MAQIVNYCRKETFEWRLSVCLPLLGVSDIQFGNKHKKFSNTVVSLEYSVTAYCHE